MLVSKELYLFLWCDWFMICNICKSWIEDWYKFYLVKRCRTGLTIIHTHGGIVLSIFRYPYIDPLYPRIAVESEIAASRLRRSRLEAELAADSALRRSRI